MYFWRRQIRLCPQCKLIDRVSVTVRVMCLTVSVAQPTSTSGNEISSGRSKSSGYCARLCTSKYGAHDLGHLSCVRTGVSK